LILDDKDEKIKQEPEDSGAGGDVKVEVKEEVMETTEVKVTEGSQIPLLVVTMREEFLEIQQENKRLHNLVTELHQKHHQHTLKVGHWST